MGLPWLVFRRVYSYGNQIYCVETPFLDTKPGFVCLQPDFPRPYSVKSCSHMLWVAQMEENGDVQEISHMGSSPLRLLWHTSSRCRYRYSCTLCLTHALRNKLRRRLKRRRNTRNIQEINKKYNQPKRGKNLSEINSYGGQKCYLKTSQKKQEP